MSSPLLPIRIFLPFALLLLASGAVVHQSDCGEEDDRPSIGELCVPRDWSPANAGGVQTAEEAAAVAPSSCALNLPCDEVLHPDGHRSVKQKFDDAGNPIYEYRCRAMPKDGEQSLQAEGHLYLRRGCPEGAVVVHFGWCAMVPAIGERCLSGRGGPGSGRCGEGATCTLRDGEGICVEKSD